MDFSINLYTKFPNMRAMKEPLPQYKAKNPALALEAMSELAEEIKSGAFKVVELKEETLNEILELPNPGGKPFTKPTGRTIKTLTIKVSNQVIE